MNGKKKNPPLFQQGWGKEQVSNFTFVFDADPQHLQP